MASKIEFIPFSDKMVEGDWRVEAINADAKEVYIAIFSGPECERLAHEYAAFKNGKHPAVQASSAPAVVIHTEHTLQLTLKTGEEISINPKDFLWAIDPRRKSGLTAEPRPAIAFITKGKA